MFVKLQRNAEGDAILIYNKDQSIFVELRETAAAQIAEQFELAPLTKCYARARLDQPNLILEEKVSPRDW